MKHAQIYKSCKISFSFIQSDKLYCYLLNNLNYIFFHSGTHAVSGHNPPSRNRRGSGDPVMGPPSSGERPQSAQLHHREARGGDPQLGARGCLAPRHHQVHRTGSVGRTPVQVQDHDRHSGRHGSSRGVPRTRVHA